jgi:hypothetical protein
MITEQQLTDNGWKLTGDPIVPAKKVILKVEGDEDHPDNVSLLVHKYDNYTQFAIGLPDGGLLNINPESIEEVNSIEKMIASYSPAY